MDFREEQYFRQWWMWMILILVCVATLIPLLATEGRSAALAPGLIVGGSVAAGLLLLFWKMRLTTEVSRKGLFVQFFPFHWKPKRIPLEDVKSYEAVVYSPILDYGGWGIKWGRKGKAYNVSGSRGVRLTFANGKRLLVGSQEPEALARAIGKWMEAQPPRRSMRGGPMGDCPR